MELQYTKINDLLDRYLNLYNQPVKAASNINFSSQSHSQHQIPDMVQTGPITYENNIPAETQKSINEFTIDRKIAHSNAIIDQIAKKYSLAQDDFSISLQNHSPPGSTPDPENLKIAPNFHTEVFRTRQNLAPEHQNPPQKQPVMSILENNSLEAQIHKLKLELALQKQSNWELNREVSKLQKQKKTKDQSRSKLQCVEEELKAAKERIIQLEVRERKLQDVVRRLRNGIDLKAK
ncbi:hypothetical protein SS50377_24205 [Spironucleus salmonicida]|uniref:Uncharacterized protein n=1 Tax=Spironucleus salmonicida TaxID=348837 RepID=V6LT97_9EUKA|nr:hypothetical protein SS50377_24205 [Spironucleus salmonicida]|eukprot:EST47872.1 Hypothetical protein SS50377_12064 [Spironucleus salmonicida]